MLRDPVSSISHAVTFLATGAVTWDMLRQGSRRGVHWLPFVAFAAGIFLCYGASAVYHGVLLPEEGLIFFRRLDHCGIYLLIAGTNTPILWFLIRPGLFRRGLLTVTWVLAIAGIALKWLLTDLPYWAIVTPYIALGWIALIPLPVLWKAVGGRNITSLAAGGILYTLGAIIDLFGTQRQIGQSFGAHEWFHVLCIAGTACHVFFVRQFVIPHIHD